MTEADGFNFVMGAVDALVWLTIGAMLTIGVMGMLGRMVKGTYEVITETFSKPVPDPFFTEEERLIWAADAASESETDQDSA